MPTNEDITDVSLGSAGVASLYLGSNMIWPKKPLGISFAFDGQLLALYGNGTPAWIYNSVSQRQVIPAVCRNNTTAISISSYTAIALLRDGTPVCWGVSQDGFNIVPASTIQNSKFVGLTSYTAFAVTKSGSVVSWGQVRDGIRSIPAGLTDVEDLLVGYNFVIARKSNGTLVGWGTNYRGMLNIPAGLNGVVSLFAGADCVIAVRGDGDYVVWGNGTVPSTFSSVDTVYVTGWSQAAGVICVLKANGNVERHGYSGATIATNVAVLANGGSYALKFDGSLLHLPP